MNNIDLKKMQLISIIWGTILFLIFAGLTAFGIFYKNETKEYKEFEKKLTEITQEYIEEKGLFFETEGKITLEELKENNKIETTIVKEKKCEGYIMVKEKVPKPYIKCGSYKTKGFSS